ncbi:MAG: dephospho-CoA kinase [Actinomycetota bacterium]
MSRLVVGLTGGIGAGKSTASALLADLGADVVDCDLLGRQVAEPGGRAHDAVVDRFGADVVAVDGSLDRAALASIVFAAPEALADLNAITHPAIDAEIATRIAGAADDVVVVLDMAILVETDLGRGQYDHVLVIEASEATRLERLASQRGMAATDARARMANQATDAQRRAVADAVITNDGDIDDLAAAIEDWWRRHVTAS